VTGGRAGRRSVASGSKRSKGEEGEGVERVAENRKNEGEQLPKFG